MTPNRWLDQTGLNLIRIVIGSYFTAIALGLIEGVDPAVLFVSLLARPLADLAGVAVLFSLAVAFMSGFGLRLTALSLAAFVLSSSAAQNYLLSDRPDTSGFWRDLALVGAVMMCYATLHLGDLRRASIILRRNARRLRGRGPGGAIAPRRLHRAPGPAPRPTIPAPAASARDTGRQTPQDTEAAGENGDEIRNIFVNI